ncbi:MAG: DNA polymerase III subunit beta [Lachnospiraceae bacterium]|nr:DNA polymerase III subunit beta [Lachnospiraceae bacterium]
MKIICTKSQFLRGVNIVSKAVSNKTTMEILECILIEAFDNCIKLTANDTELGIETTIEGEILVPGKIALEAKLFSEIIKKIPDSEVILETEPNGNTSICCEQIQCNIMGKQGDDFSHLPEITKENKITISQYDLKEIIRQTIFSVSDNENNKLMTGELLSIDNNQLTITSLDGHRISVRTIELTESYPKTEVIIPGKTLSEISKILPGEAKDFVNLYLTDKHILFEFDETLVVSRLLEGKFYNIGQMLSNDYETKITVNKMELLRCLDRSTLFVKESDKKPIILKIENNKMDLMISSQIGSMQDQIALKKEGKDLMIGFNPKFLVDALRVIDEEEVTIYMINSIAPCIIRDEKASYLYLILPINVNNSGI